MADLEEEEEETGCYTAKKRAHMYHHSVMPMFMIIWTKLFIIRRELLVFLSEMSRVLLQGHELLRLGAWYWLGAPNGWDIMGRPQVLGPSVGEHVHLIFIGYTGWSYLYP